MDAKVGPRLPKCPGRPQSLTRRGRPYIVLSKYLSKAEFISASLYASKPSTLRPIIKAINAPDLAPFAEAVGAAQDKVRWLEHI